MARAVDVYGNVSSAKRSQVVTVIPDASNTVGSSEYYRYEPNDRWYENAKQILPKTDWYNMGDVNVQTHYFHNKNDYDSVWFTVPATLNNNGMIVWFETNAGPNNGEMFSINHLIATENGPDTRLTLFDANGKVLHTCDDYGKVNASRGGTRFARFELLLEPGVYYVQVSLATVSGWALSAPYAMHLGMWENDGSIGPTAPTSVVLTPSEPSITDKLICTATGSTSEDGTEDSIEYLYVWYRNGEIVPFVTNVEVKPWETRLYTLRQAKNFAAGYGPANEISGEFTKDGDQWYCDVFAYDKVADAYSEAVRSNTVTIGSTSWDLTIDVAKTFRGGKGIVEAGDQSVTIGWRYFATHGFDPGYDESLPTYDLPAIDGMSVITGAPVSLGTAYSVGFDNVHKCLTKDMKPYGASATWFIKVEMGDPDFDTVSECRISWPARALPVSSVGNLTVTRMRMRADGVYEPVPGTTQVVDGQNRGEIVLGEAELEELQTDDFGQKFVVFRFSLGAPDEMQVIKLKTGWNLISLKVLPLNNNVSDIFTVDGKQVDSGAVWRYDNGGKSKATALEPAKGYYIYALMNVEVTVYGSMDTSAIHLDEGANLIGPIYDISDFQETYNAKDYPDVLANIEVANDGNPQIFKFVPSGQGGSYAPAWVMDSKAPRGDRFELTVGNAYWIFTTKAFDLPVIVPTK
ncbi:MAG: pre-peptidase C-terminal domain-containing protein [Victivallales bacterium]|nr:pre-peptidase C-terminal domain-containing protein [Victivallales bacterium]